MPQKQSKKTRKKRKRSQNRQSLIKKSRKTITNRSVSKHLPKLFNKPLKNKYNNHSYYLENNGQFPYWIQP